MSVANPPKGMHRITAQLYYADVESAINWLGETFRFNLTEKYCGDDGVCVYAELAYKDAIVLIAPETRFAKACSPIQTKSFSMSLLVYIDNLADFYQQLLSKGVSVVEPPAYQGWGDETFRVEDCEGHLWTFAQHVKDVAVAK
jgi:uncharacterized glyoxalase superfamily protein PhnB